MLNWIQDQETKTLYLEEVYNDSKPEEIAPLRLCSEKSNSCTSNSEYYSSSSPRLASSNLGAILSLKIDLEETSERMNYNYKLLKESVGHTEIQVLVGALLGFIGVRKEVDSHAMIQNMIQKVQEYYGKYQSKENSE